MFVNNVCAYVNKMFVCVCALTDKENKLESECVPMCARMHEREILGVTIARAFNSCAGMCCC